MYSLFTTLIALGVAAGESSFRFFRCDACSATIHQLQGLLEKTTKHRKTKPLREVELVLIPDKLCTVQTFDKRNYGVKEVGHDAYLFGPGVPSHVPKDQGFGQMGMGDYDSRLVSFCKLFLEQFGEAHLYQLFRNNQLKPEIVCHEECLSDSSGSAETRRSPTHEL